MSGGESLDLDAVRAVEPSTGHRIRPVGESELPTCAAIWRDALNDYLGRLAQPEVPDDFAPILRLYDHLRTTDPTTFLVAERAGGREEHEDGDDHGDRGSSGPPAIDGFAAVVRRGQLAFLSMLFVRPGVQGRGLGRALLDRAMPVAPEPSPSPSPSPTDDPGADVAWRATATDSAQPISNGLYGSLGMVPRVPLLRLVGLPERPGAFEPLPDGIEAVPFDAVRDEPDGLGRSALSAELSTLDRHAVGFDRSPDHAFHVREGRVGFLYCDRDGHAVGYGYTSEAGRIGPVAVREASLLGPVLGHLVHAVRPRGAFGLWVPGAAGSAIVPLLRAGFRFEGFPVLLCWDRPFADFERFIPTSPGLL